MFEITNNTGTYADFVIAKRFINCANITRKEFINALITDAKEAIKSYNDNVYSRAIEIFNNTHTEYVNKEREKVITKAIAFANKTWKTEKRRNKYIEDELSKFNAKYEKPYIPTIPALGFFDMNGDCGTTIGNRNKCILYEEAFNYPDAIGECYDILVNRNYFKKAIGWQFKYKGRTNTYTSSFRPTIELLFNEETTKEIEAAQDSLNNSVDNFYKNSKYFGD